MSFLVLCHSHDVRVPNVEAAVCDQWPFFAVATALVQGRLMKQSHTILSSVLLQASPWFVALVVQIVAHVPRGHIVATIGGLFLTSLVWMPLNAVVMTNHLKASRRSNE